MSLPATVVGVTREAWDELRVHKLRVLLSLIGVAVAVAALTAVVAIADLQRQYLAEQNDRWGGREATIAIATFSETGEAVDADAWEEHVDRVLERYQLLAPVAQRERPAAGPAARRASSTSRPGSSIRRSARSTGSS